MLDRVHPDIKMLAAYLGITVLWFWFAHGYGAGFFLDTVTFLLSFTVWGYASWRYFKLHPLTMFTE